MWFSLDIGGHAVSLPVIIIANVETVETDEIYYNHA